MEAVLHGTAPPGHKRVVGIPCGCKVIFATTPLDANMYLRLLLLLQIVICFPTPPMAAVLHGTAPPGHRRVVGIPCGCNLFFATTPLGANIYLRQLLWPQIVICSPPPHGGGSAWNRPSWLQTCGWDPGYRRVAGTPSMPGHLDVVRGLNLRRAPASGRRSRCGELGAWR